MATRLKSYTLILLLGLALPVLADPGETVTVITPTGVKTCIETGGGTVICPP